MCELQDGGIISSVRPRVPATETSLDAELLRGYELAPGSYDEVFSAPGVLRPAWKLFLKGAEKLTRTEYMHRWEQAQRLLRQNSLTYPDLGDPWRGGGRGNWMDCRS